MNIRLGTISDTEKISQTHKASIQNLCKDEYSPENIEKWTSILNQEIYENAIEEKILLVAEETNDIVGLGILDVKGAEVCAIYVHPDHTGKGIAKNILLKLESLALERKVSSLNLCATINAVGFYKHYNYIVDGKTVHQLPNGAELKCIKMHKVIKNLVKGNHAEARRAQ
ncbi:MAG: GNAT family N-acetyltransferase [Gammaproteobacteria bacterium]|nr:GNAT family N-acetyltransferase [Gammaproteobacteria bacterium]